jgi:hypothetical protein
MKRFILIMFLMVSLATTAQADLVTFSFNSLSDGADSTAISTYMTGLYGSTVNVSDAAARHDDYSPYDWKYNDTFIWTHGPTAIGEYLLDMEIVFASVPITGISGYTDGYVLDAGLGTDFKIYAYDSTYNTGSYTAENPNPSALVYTHTWDASSGTTIDIPDITFSRNVSLLVFSNDGLHDVAIDNLKVYSSVVPVPGAFLLGLLGLGAAGMKLRKYA